MSEIARLPDLASRALGGSVVAANDETFAAAGNLIAPGPAAHDPTAFDHRGKVYDGWETRRRRQPGVDQAIVRLAAPTIVAGVDIDTSFFTGNFPPHASVEGTLLLGYPDRDAVLGATWTTLVERSALAGDAHNLVAVTGPERLVSHVRLTIDPDGGVARLRVHGRAVPDPRWLGGRVDLAATLNGGAITGCSNLFYSSPSNLLAPGRAQVMSDGWETARRRDGGNDWVTVRLGAEATVHDVVIDTTRFVGNAPGHARLTDVATGTELLARTPLLPDTEHRFAVVRAGPLREVRLDIHPDGGLSRLRIHGTLTGDARTDAVDRWLGLLGPELAASVDHHLFFEE